MMEAPLSESHTLGVALARLHDALDILPDSALNREVMRRVVEVKRLLRVLRSQAAHGRHRNPPLILLSNPPMRYKGSQSGHGSLKFLDLISDECHAILYRHIEDGKPYRHDFERPTQLVAVERNGKKDVLITSEDESPIWQDF